MGAKKRRVDEILIARSLCTTKAEANVLVMASSVLLENGEVVGSPALKIDETREIRIRHRKNEPYVSRAGRKLAAAVDTYDLAPLIAGATCIDIGCSTGGFTDVLLHNNCSRVYAVDVGARYTLLSQPRPFLSSLYLVFPLSLLFPFLSHSFTHSQIVSNVHCRLPNGPSLPYLSNSDSVYWTGRSAVTAAW
jgi:hypothetical protein